MNIGENLKNIQQFTSSAKIIAVVKYVTSDSVVEAFNCGLRHFGENKVQSAETKFEELSPEVKTNSEWHFLGHLQTNKVNKVVGVFDYIHSVDSLKLAKVISESAKKKNIVQKVLLQVNIAGEESKFGLNPDETEEIFSEVLKLDSIKVAGLMTMAPLTFDEKVQRNTFRGLRELKEKLQTKFNFPMSELSMGMSNDYKIAVEEGATLIRIGQALFN